MRNYDHKKIEEKWREKWEKDDLYKTSDKQDKPKYYILDMFPYPSGAGLHVGHPKGYIATDIVARMKMLQGYNVLHPMGWDAFGLPTENFAIKNKIHPSIATEKNISIFKAQLEKLGFTYDWSREINTTDPEFYKWTQWVFLQMFKNGLAYESYEPIIWCPSCQTGLAMEDLENGKCERCGSEVERKPMRQWVLKITDYADRLLNDLEKLPQWEDSIKEMQRNWIGKSEGAIVKFSIFNFQFSNNNQFSPAAHCAAGQVIPNNKIDCLEVFTTRPDTLFGCTYMVVCPEHKLITNYKLQITNYNEVCKYIEQAKKKSDLERTDLAKEKTGVELKGIKAINPVNNEEIPIFVADYVLAGYGTGAIMAVPAHDERDFEFAKKYGLQIKEVVAPFLRDNPKEGKETERRDVVTVIIKNPQNNTFLCLNWNTTEWKSFPTGGIDNDNLIEAAKREVREETGYINIKFIRQLGDSIYAEFYRPHKDSNVFAHFQYLLFELENEEIIEVSAKEKEQHEAIWIKEENVESFINVWNQKIAWKRLVYGDFAYCEEGININSDFPDEVLNNAKTPEKNSEAFDGREDCYPRRGSGTCHSINSIDCNKKFVKSEYDAEPAEGFEPSDNEMTSSCPRHAAGSSAPNSLYQKNKNITKTFNGLPTEEAKKKMIEWLEEKGVGKRAVNYKLKDWVFSRQRYWGEPIPLIYCEKCAKTINKNKNIWKLEIGNWKLTENCLPRCAVRGRGKLKIENLEFTKGELLNPGWVADENLPLTLPEVEHYEPTGTGESPLANMPKWVNTTCPKCGAPAKRETNTMPQWAGSSWYYLRYIDPRNNKALVDKEKEKYWSPVDLYVGGAEHATRHLIYARFWHKFLYDIGVVNYEEPFTRLHHVGLILAEDGRKMSKRWGNVINPDEVVEKFGADAMRVYEMFMGPFSQPCAWSENGLRGAKKFLEKVWALKQQIASDFATDSRGINSLLHKTIKKVGEDIEEFKFNTAISAMMIFVNELEKENKISLILYSKFLILLSPFAPHITEELWQGLRLGSTAPAEAGDYGAGEAVSELGRKESIFKEKWPEYDPELVKDKMINLVVQVNGKLRDTIPAPADIGEEEARKLALTSGKIKKWVAGKEIVKVIFVKGKLVNIAVK